MANRIWNFNAGPSTLPLAVLEKAKADLPDYDGTGMAVMELSHRSKQYAAIHESAKSLMRELYAIPENYKILFLQGGASLQFAMIPMNLLKSGESADYINTGTWSKKAIKEGKIAGNIKIAASSEDDKFTCVPAKSELNLDPNAAYCHLTSNNTIAGTMWLEYPDTGSVPLIADMSSDIMCRRIDISKFGLIYAGAQKNLGPSGVTVVIIRDDLVDRSRDDIPTLLQYKTHVEKDSLFNTPPTYGVYLMKLVLEWIKGQGGLEAVENVNHAKAKLLYGMIDSNADFFKSPIAKDSRSIMNVVFRLPSEELEQQFIAEAGTAGFGGVKGHRSVGGIRISMYNAMPLEGIEALTGFMKTFMEKNG